jgi:CDP-diacylglycerol pyrophosphatase
MIRVLARRLFLLAPLLLAGCVTTTTALPPPPVHPNGQVLWGIIHERCTPDQRDHNSPAPCALVHFEDGETHGYVVLKDLTGKAQHLLMPTAKITGIEDSQLLQPNAVNYFAEAWRERHFVGDRLGHPLDDRLLSVAVNSMYGRSQDQLHLHIDCVHEAVAAALRNTNSGPRLGKAIRLKGQIYRVHWLTTDQLRTTNPFKWLADTTAGARQNMGAWTIAIVGGTDRRGRAGFYLLTDRANPSAGDPGSAEDLQDHDCAVAAHRG